MGLVVKADTYLNMKLKGEYRISVIFLIFSFLWITFSDKWLFSMPIDVPNRHLISTAKGLLFITSATLLIFFLIRQERLKLKIEREENQQLIKIMNEVENYIVITNSKGQITWVNKAFEKHTGYTLEEIKNEYPTNILLGDESCKQAEKEIAKAVNKQTSCTVEIINYTKTKQKYWVKIHFAPLFDDSNELKGFFSIQNNITSYRNNQKLLCDQNKLLKEIAWITSHEIRRPIASILGLNNILKHQTSCEEKEETFNLLNSCTEDLDIIIRGIGRRINEIENLPT